MSLRTIELSGLLALCASSLLVGCDDGGETQCSGHGSCAVNSFSLDEGGEVRIIKTTFYDGTPVRVDAQALFFRNQQPATRALAGTVIEGACEDWSSGDIFDNGPTARSIEIANTREYIDVGASVVLKQGANTYTLDGANDTMDAANFIQHDRMYYAEIPATGIEANAPLTVEGLVMSDGVDPLNNPAEDNELFLPADFPIIAPAVTNQEMVFPAGQPVDFQWGKRPTGAPPDITFLAFLDTATGEVRGQCLSAPNQGAYTVPTSMISAMGTEGLILVGTFVHHAYNYDERRLDVLGINCHLVPWRVQ